MMALPASLLATALPLIALISSMLTTAELFSLPPFLAAKSDSSTADALKLRWDPREPSALREALDPYELLENDIYEI